MGVLARQTVQSLTSSSCFLAEGPRPTTQIGVAWMPTVPVCSEFITCDPLEHPSPET